MVMFVAAAALPIPEEESFAEAVQDDSHDTDARTSAFAVWGYFFAGVFVLVVLAMLILGDWPKRRNGLMYAWSNWKQARAEAKAEQARRQVSVGATQVANPV